MKGPVMVAALVIGAVGIAGIICFVVGLLFKAKSLARTGICAAVLAAGAGVAAALYFTPRKPRKRDPQPETTLVEVTPARAVRRRVRVVVMGTVVPARRVELQSEVSGRVVEQSPDLVPGGVFPAGRVLLRVDPRDYRTALERQRALLADAEFNLKVEEGRGAIARREWQLLEKELDTAGARRDLALRVPHLARVKAALASARSALAQAELNLERTTITAPFNALVREEAVDLGQLVGPASKLATLIGTDRFWVRASVPVDRLKWIKLPDASGAGGAAARVIQECGGGQLVERPGRVVRLLGDLDPAGRQARVLVEVADPLDLKVKGEKPAAPLLLGAYVRVEIEGPELAEVIALPRTALRAKGNASYVWIMNAERKLEERRVKILWRLPDEVLIAEGTGTEKVVKGGKVREETTGIGAGDLIVTSPVPNPIPGIRLRTKEMEAKEKAEKKAREKAEKKAREKAREKAGEKPPAEKPGSGKRGDK